MRFRFMQVGDIPEVMRLYSEMQNERTDEEIHYPSTNEHTVEEFALSLYAQLASNPNWFSICAVVGSKLQEDAQGVRHVVGGKVKGFICVNLSQRTVGNPKNIAFTELLIVDAKFRQHDIARKLVQLMAIEATQRGAHVLEAAWTPGSVGSKIWERLGCVPYRVLGGWITTDGVPRTDMPMLKAPSAPVEDEAELEPTKRKRGRPRKPNAPSPSTEE